jgi:hypothetical protein
MMRLTTLRRSQAGWAAPLVNLCSYRDEESQLTELVAYSSRDIAALEVFAEHRASPVQICVSAYEPARP